MLILNDGQKSGIEKVLRWYFNPNKKQLFFFAGSAGTGKSTCVSTAVEMIGLLKYQVIYVTPTGKAASVLRKKGCIANTVHATFYVVLQDSKTGKTHFAKKKKLSSAIKLIVIDEFSMVNGKMIEDILSFGIPVLALGDPGQLPPMYYPNPYLKNPDVFLTEVMRQDGESGIIHLATLARHNVPIDYGEYIESRVIHIGELNDIEKYDVVLCWTNKACDELNRTIRKKKGLLSKYPLAGEKLLCLRNNYEYELRYMEDMVLNPVNGMLMYNVYDFIDPDSVADYLNLTYTPDFLENECDFKFFETKVSKIPFDMLSDGETFDSEKALDINHDTVVMRYGYACTVTKSQGSEWDNVLVIDDYHGNHDEYGQWLYTAITRAKEKVTLAREI